MLEKKREQSNVTELLRKRLDDIQQKYKMVKQKEENEKNSLRHESYEVDKIKAEICRVENEIDSTVKTIQELRSKREKVASATLRQSALLGEKNLKLHQVLNDDFSSKDSGSDEKEIPPAFHRIPLDM